MHTSSKLNFFCSAEVHEKGGEALWIGETIFANLSDKGLVSGREKELLKFHKKKP